MRLLLVASLFAASALAQKACGFPNGPDCKSLGKGASGLEQFADDGCCLLPFRCGNGDGGERCERVSGGGGNNNNNNNNNPGNGNGNGNGNGGQKPPQNSGGNQGADPNCGFPNGPDCKSLGRGANGLERFADDGCCLLPFRCGNGDGGERCERVAVGKGKSKRLRRSLRV